MLNKFSRLKSYVLVILSSLGLNLLYYEILLFKPNTHNSFYDKYKAMCTE